MTTTTQPLPSAPVPAGPVRRPRTTAQVVAIWAGAAVALAGVLIALAGVGIAALFGGDDAVGTGSHRVDTSTAALVSGVAAVDDTRGASDVLGDARLKVTAEEAGGKPVFVGVARAADVDRYLAGTATDRVTDVDVLPFGIDRERRNGRASAFGAPGTQRFWIAHAGSAEDGTAGLDWKVRDGDYRVVVMNADGTPGVETRSELGVVVPHGTAIGAGILVAGMLLGGAGLAALAHGLRRRPA